MLYLSADYVLSAINQLSSVHPFLGITFLTCKKENLPVGDEIEFIMDSETKAFMNSVHKICEASSYYFQPYETNKGKQWVKPNYPSHGLQRGNTGSFRDAFIHEKNGRTWGWQADYVRQIAKAAFSGARQKASLPAIAVWVMKDLGWKDTTSIDDVVEKFIKDYHITKYERAELFIEDAEFPSVQAFQNEPITWNQLSNSLSLPPDAEPDQEGTLSYLELINVGPCNRVEMQLSPRLNIITGDNGLGKTFLMDCAWWALTNTWAGNEARPKYPEGSKRASIGFAISGKSKTTESKSALYDNKKLTWKRSADTATIPGLIIYALVDGSYAVWDPSKMNALQDVPYVFTKQQVWDGEEGKIEGLIRDWVKWQNTPAKYPFEVFQQVLGEMSPPDLGPLTSGEPIRTLGYNREIPTIKYPYGIVPVTNSSAGVSRIITLAYLMVWAWNEHKENCKLKGVEPDSRIVVMVDELEAHLHPKWQRTILPALITTQKYLADELEVQFIIATHSPLIMASAESIFNLESDKLFQLKLDVKTSDAFLEEEDFIKYGQVNSWLTSPVFNLGQARSTDAEQAINEAKSLQLEDDPSNQAVKAAHDKLLQTLSQNDSFWPRWIYFAESHGVTL